MIKFTSIIISLLFIHILFVQPISANIEELEKEVDVQENNSIQKVSIILLSGTIDGGLKSSLERRVDIAKKNKSELIIFELDTYGGSLEPAFDISEYISSIKDIKTIAFIPKKAISAGALIAISCNEIYMSPQAELGDCEPIVPSSEGGYKTVGEKIQTVLRTKFRKFAEKNGYPILLAEAMVTKEIEVYYITTEEAPDGYHVSGRELKEMVEDEKKKITSKKLIIEEGQLLTMHTREAYDYKFAKGIVDDRADLLRLLNVDKTATTLLETSWSEEMVRFLSSVSPFLLGIGFVALWMEFKAPGFGLPGIVGILCLTIVFLSKYLVGLAEAPEIIMFFIGVALIAVEVLLIPGFGIAGILGLILLLMGLVLSFQDFTIPRTPYDVDLFTQNVFTIICCLLGSGIASFIIFRYIPGIPGFNRLILTASETAQGGYVIPSQPSGGDELTGKKGKTITVLHPTGKIDVDDHTFDVVTEGDYIERGQTVEVVEVKGNRIVVKSVLA